MTGGPGVGRGIRSICSSGGFGGHAYDDVGLGTSCGVAFVGGQDSYGGAARPEQLDLPGFGDGTEAVAGLIE